MNISLTASAVFLGLTVNFVSASCMHPKGGVPEVPDPYTATERQMMEAQLKVEEYVRKAKGFATCARRSSDNRAERTLKKATRLANKFDRANMKYKTRLANNTSILRQ